MSYGVVSIVLPTYNRAHLIGETIQSLINQSYSDWELLIEDDGSNDQTLQVVQSFHDPRISFETQEHIGKLGAIRNRGIKRAQGSFIAFMDSDDLWETEKLERQLRLFEQHPAAGFTFCNFNEFGPGAAQPPDRQFFVGPLFKDILLSGRFGICMPSLLFKNEVLKTTGLMNEDYSSGADIDFFFKLCFYFTGIFSNERLVNIRKHEQSSSQRFGEVVFHEHINMLENFSRHGWLSEREKNKLIQGLYYRLGLLQSRKGEKALARAAFCNALASNPFWWKPWGRWIQTWLPK